MNFFRILSLFFILNLSLYFPGVINGSIDDYFPSQPVPSSSNYGETGLIVMPNARMMEGGVLKFHYSSSFPEEYTSIVASPFSWFEATYRYTELENALYGPFNFSGNQSYKDKGFDLKVSLLNERTYLPQVSFGIRDLAGTGLSASEYIVASKRFGRLDATLGVGWGVLGRNANIKNPLTPFHDSFKYRNASDASQGGEFNAKDWFSGQYASLFGGLEYSLPRYGLTLKAEYDTTNPDESFGFPAPLEVKSRVNLGLVYALGNWVDLGLSFERGSQLRFSFDFKANYGKDYIVPKMDKPLNVVPLNEEQKKRVSENKEVFYRSVNLGLRQETIYLQGASITEDFVDIVIAQARFLNNPRAVGRTARIVSALAPNEVERLNVYVMNGDIQVSEVSLNRKEFDKANTYLSSPQEVLSKSKITSTSDSPMYKDAKFQPSLNFPEFFWKMSPALKHQIGGPEAFYLGQLWWRVDATVKFARGFSLYTTLGFDIYNNFNELNNPSASTIPNVRSNIQEYLKKGENNIAKMKLEYLWSPFRDVYARIDVGILEEMFGGYGGEIYYRPFDSKFSLGLMAHKVRQRQFDQRFSFRKYETTTGFFQFIYDWPGDVTSQVLVGKYLAKDKGATLDLSRRFKTGFRLGVFATLTDLSKEEFGEGSFDKGFYFVIPMDVLYPKWQTGNISFGLHPLTKDGGATINYHNSLYGLLGDTNRESLLRDWPGLLD